MPGDGGNSLLEGVMSPFLGGAERRRVIQFIEGLNTPPIEKRVQVLNPPNVGVVWESGNNKAIFMTGILPEQDAIDCNVVIVKGKDRSGMMHVSPQTMPDEYVGRRVARPWNTDVDQQLEAMLSAIGGAGSVESITVVTGDTTLARELEQFLTGGENVWGAGQIASPVPQERIRVFDAGTGKKLVVAKPDEGTLQVAHLSSRPKVEEFAI